MRGHAIKATAKRATAKTVTVTVPLPASHEARKLVELLAEHYSGSEPTDAATAILDILNGRPALASRHLATITSCREVSAFCRVRRLPGLR